MKELVPGLWHWTAPHEHIRVDVSSYYLQEQGILIDPMIPAEGLEWFEEHGPPEHALMTNRHHDRQAWAFREAFGCPVHCISNGVHEIQARGPAEPFEFGETLPGGVIAHEVDVICPDETALHIPSFRALACADGITGYGESGTLGFVPDYLMDDPERTKRGLRDAYRALLDLDFEILLLAHGPPVVGGAKDALRAFAHD